MVTCFIPQRVLTAFPEEAAVVATLPQGIHLVPQNINVATYTGINLNENKNDRHPKQKKKLSY